MGVGTLIIAELPRQWDHPERYCSEPAPVVLVSRAQTSPTEALGSTAVGAAVPCTASRSVKAILDQPVALEKASRLTSCDCGTDLRTCTMGTLNEASKFTTTSDAGTLLQLGFVHLLGRMCKFHAAQLRLVGWIWESVNCRPLWARSGESCVLEISEKNHMAKGLQMLKLGSSPWSSRRFV